MKILYELQEPFKYSWNLARILFIVCMVLFIILLLIIFLPRFYHKYFNKIIRKSKVPSLKIKYVRKLDELLNMVKSGRINNKEAYTRLSLYIREFVKKASGINVLSLSKEEIKGMGIHSLGLLMEEYYPPEFSKYSNSDIRGSIERSIEVIKGWK